MQKFQSVPEVVLFYNQKIVLTTYHNKMQMIQRTYIFFIRFNSYESKMSKLFFLKKFNNSIVRFQSKTELFHHISMPKKKYIRMRLNAFFWHCFQKRSKSDPYPLMFDNSHLEIQEKGVGWTFFCQIPAVNIACKCIYVELRLLQKIR